MRKSGPTVIGFDTATALTVAFVWRDGTLVENEPPEDVEAHKRRPAHSAELLVELKGLMDRIACRFADIDEVVVGVGPGTYTGSRIGVATARALAQALNVPLKPVSTLAALAQGMAGAYGEARQLAPLIDAKRGQIFGALYARSDGPLRGPQPEIVCAPEQLVEALGIDDAGCCLAAGDGALLYREQLEALSFEVANDEDPVHLLRGLNLLEVSRQAETLPIEQITPTYLRLPDAELTLRAGKLRL